MTVNQNMVYVNNRERKCADTIDTVLVPWTGHLQCSSMNIFFKQNIWKRFYQAALGNCYGLKLPKCSLQFKKNKFVVLLTYFQHILVPYANIHILATVHTHTHTPVSYTHLTLPTILRV